MNGTICLSSHDHTELDITPQDEYAKELEQINIEMNEISEQKEDNSFQVFFL